MGAVARRTGLGGSRRLGARRPPPRQPARGRRWLTSVIDFGGLAVGDLACDLQPAWNVFEGASRRAFLAELQVDDASWLRGRGWALSQALIALPYYWRTEPGIVEQSRRALGHVLAEGVR